MARAWYVSIEDYYVIDFSADPDFPFVRKWDGKTEDWAMFTHGVCSVVVNKHLDFSQVAIFGRHLPEPAETTLPVLIEQAAFKLRRMGEEVEAQAPGSFCARQCRAASECLRQEQAALVRALLESRQQQVIASGENRLGARMSEP